MEDFLTSMGLPGVVILALAWVCREAWKRISELQDARIADRDKFSEAYQQLTRETNAALEAIKDAVEAKK